MSSASSSSSAPASWRTATAQRRPEDHGHHRARAVHRHQEPAAFDDLPAWARSFLRTPKTFVVDQWVVVTCAIVMAAGTAAGGWRIIRTMGHKMVKLQPVHGFAAETTAALIIHYASCSASPCPPPTPSPTSIMGVGAVKRFGAVKWTVVERILWAWVFTLPVCCWWNCCGCWAGPDGRRAPGGFRHPAARIMRG
jgi:phosphate/sulfate permease